MIQTYNYNRNATVRVYFMLCILFLMFFCSCDPGVVFKESNPPGIATIQQIPEPFHGSYMCSSDSSYIHIRSRSIIRESSYQLVSSIEDVRDSETCALIDGGLYVPGREECFPFDYISEDSISADIYLLDTMFVFDDGEELKYHKEQLFINTRLHSGSWMTWTLQVSDDGTLAFALVSIPADESVVQALAQDYETDIVDRDRPQYILSPTMKEFDMILSSGYRDICETLTPVNIEKDFPDANLF